MLCRKLKINPPETLTMFAPEHNILSSRSDHDPDIAAVAIIISAALAIWLVTLSKLQACALV